MTPDQTAHFLRSKGTLATREDRLDEAVKRAIWFRIETRERWLKLWWFFVVPSFGEPPPDFVRDVKALFEYLDACMMDRASGWDATKEAWNRRCAAVAHLIT